MTFNTATQGGLVESHHTEVFTAEAALVEDGDELQFQKGSVLVLASAGGICVPIDDFYKLIRYGLAIQGDDGFGFDDALVSISILRNGVTVGTIAQTFTPDGSLHVFSGQITAGPRFVAGERLEVSTSILVAFDPIANVLARLTLGFQTF